jgi:acyl carrier protein
LQTWLIVLLIAGGTAALLTLQTWSERRRALRHMRGRPSISDDDFGRLFFSPDRAEIAARLRKILSGHIDVGLSRLSPDDKLVQDIRMDSLDSMSTVEFVIDVEKHFGISIPDSIAERMQTLRDVADFVATHLSEEKPPTTMKRNA